MGKKLYQPTPEGGIRFISKRPWGVDIPNYVYDIWMPVVGVCVVGVYGVYCRLEREGTVKAITQGKLARACRIGTTKLQKVNQCLERCGFITVKTPRGYERTMHWTTEITILEPPRTVSVELITQYSTLERYDPLSTWLVAELAANEADDPTNESVNPIQECEAFLNGNANVDPLVVESLNKEQETAGTNSVPSPSEPMPTTFQQWGDLLRETRIQHGNIVAILVRMHNTLYPDHDSPDYGRVGVLAKRVGGVMRLAQLLWETSTRPPAGNVCDYIEATAKGQRKDRGIDPDEPFPMG